MSAAVIHPRHFTAKKPNKPLTFFPGDKVTVLVETYQRGSIARPADDSDKRGKKAGKRTQEDRGISITTEVQSVILNPAAESIISNGLVHLPRWQVTTEDGITFTCREGKPEVTFPHERRVIERVLRRNKDLLPPPGDAVWAIFAERLSLGASFLPSLAFLKDLYHKGAKFPPVKVFLRLLTTMLRLKIDTFNVLTPVTTSEGSAIYVVHNATDNVYLVSPEHLLATREQARTLFEMALRVNDDSLHLQFVPADQLESVILQQFQEPRVTVHRLPRPEDDIVPRLPSGTETRILGQLPESTDPRD